VERYLAQELQVSNKEDYKKVLGICPRCFSNHLAILVHFSGGNGLTMNPEAPVYLTKNKLQYCSQLSSQN
jgi:hypothetical protein